MSIFALAYRNLCSNIRLYPTGMNPNLSGEPIPASLLNVSNMSRSLDSQDLSMRRPAGWLAGVPLQLLILYGDYRMVVGIQPGSLHIQIVCRHGVLVRFTPFKHDLGRFFSQRRAFDLNNSDPDRNPRLSRAFGAARGRCTPVFAGSGRRGTETRGRKSAGSVHDSPQMAGLERGFVGIPAQRRAPPYRHAAAAAFCIGVGRLSYARISMPAHLGGRPAAHPPRGLVKLWRVMATRNIGVFPVDAAAYMSRSANSPLGRPCVLALHILFWMWMSRMWALVSQLVSSQLDADRLDYLLRDSYFTGAVYGRIDLYRIANTLEIWRGGADDPFNGAAVTNPKGIGAVESYVLVRHLMYGGVYFHKTPSGMESLLSGVFTRASELPDGKTGLGSGRKAGRENHPGPALRDGRLFVHRALPRMDPIPKIRFSGTLQHAYWSAGH